MLLLSAILGVGLTLDAGEFKTVTVVPLGKVPKAQVASIAARLRSVYGFQVDIAPTTPLPKSAYYPPRARYRADRLLTWLGPRFRTDHILGITAQDISTTKGKVADWGVFGLGQMPGRTTVISSFRLRKPGKITVSERLDRIAVHELGHNLGLPHCPNRCIMSDAEGSIKSVDSTGTFCKSCRERMK
ncbi:MAG: hypothetical protein K8R88_03670 [Armatimonadetes bacterium]|nr:hypothetical protein [Armatimonadota bacterium]